MRVGYVRVSSADQNTVRQLDGVDVERVFTDRASGKDTDRPKLDEMLAFVRDGDTVLVHSMDRLARNLDDLRRTVRALTGKGVRVEFAKENLTFTGEDSPMATLKFSGDRPGPRGVRSAAHPPVAPSGQGGRRPSKRGTTPSSFGPWPS
jgi:DNA invertase Pin-like site-specific DNA recombinase